MKQMRLVHTGLELVTKRTRKREFLDEMNLVIPWSELLSLIAAYAPVGRTDWLPFATEVMLRIQLLQQFFDHSDPAMEKALNDIPLYQHFTHLGVGMTRLPDESTILRFRHMLEANVLGACAAEGIGCNGRRKVPLRPGFSGCGNGHSPQKSSQIGLFSHPFRFDAFCRAGS